MKSLLFTNSTTGKMVQVDASMVRGLMRWPGDAATTICLAGGETISIKGPSEDFRRNMDVWEKLRSGRLTTKPTPPQP